MFRLIRLIIFCGFCFSVYSAWQHKEELMSKALSYLLSHPVEIKGIKLDFEGLHLQRLEINPAHSRLYDLSLCAQGCIVKLSAWDLLKRPFPLKRVAIQQLHLTHYPTGAPIQAMFPRLAIEELSIEQCHIENKNYQGTTYSEQRLIECSFYNVDIQSPIDLSSPDFVVHAPDFRPSTIHPKRPLLRRAPPTRSPRLSAGHIIY